MTLSAKQLYFALVAVCLLGFVALLAGAYGADALLQRKSATVREARLRNLVFEQEQQQLVKSKADIEKYRSLADIAQHIVPQDKDQAQTVREIVNIAKGMGIGEPIDAYEHADEAAGVVRRHRLWELYLTRRLELPHDHVHRDAEAMEHALPEETVEALDARLGYPERDPHGRLIPREPGADAPREAAAP